MTLSGWRLEQCSIDFAFGLRITDQKTNVQIRINSSFFIVRDDSRLDFDPVNHPERLGPVLALLRSPIQKVSACKNGTLMVFLPQASIIVPSDEQFEAWELSGPNGLLVVSLPGGDLAIWQ